MSRNNKKIRKEDAAMLKKELKAYGSQGIALWLDGMPSTPGNITKACRLAENGTYMRDYVRNEEGSISQIRFDLVKE